MSKAKRKLLAAASRKLKPFSPPNAKRVVKKTIVMGLLERGQNGDPSQVRTQLVETPRRDDIQSVVRSHVEPGSFLMTDALQSYAGLQTSYLHMAVNHAIKYAMGRIHTNGLENFWSLLSRTIHGTYVACEPFHLTAYLDEQTYRFNQRRLDDGQRFNKVLGMVSGKRMTYPQLTGKIAGEQRPDPGLPN